MIIARGHQSRQFGRDVVSTTIRRETSIQAAPTELTRRIVAAAKTLEISVPDHIIMTYSAYYSFNDNGIMPKC